MAPGLTIIAEVGVNHDGKMDSAEWLAQQACSFGADVVKFQLFDPAQHAGDYRRVLEPLALSPDQMAALFAYVRSRGLEPMCTPFDAPSLEAVCALKPVVMKVSSRHARDHAFLREIRRKWDGPIWQSFGACEMADVHAAVRITDPAVLFHAVSVYPAPAEALRLRRVAEFVAAFPERRIGYSDHSARAFVPPCAVALGATVIEAHICGSTGDGPDFEASYHYREFEEMAGRCRYIASGLVGDMHALERATRDVWGFPVTA